jgi:flagellar operon protein
MTDLPIQRYSRPIITGQAYLDQQAPAKPITEKVNGQASFQQLLQKQIQDNKTLNFSKHAIQRVSQREIDLTADQLNRLNEGLRLAEQKGLNDSMILVDKTAFIVNIKNNMVVTTVSGDELKGKVFTNIDGTVII